MKKLFFLFNETTVIDFPFLWNLFKRYYIVPVILFILLNPVGYFYYSTQKEIYLSENTMTNTSMKNNDAFDDIGNLLGQRSYHLNDIELVNLSQQWKIKLNLVNELVKRPDIGNLVFNYITERSVVPVKQMFKGCGEDTKCLSNSLSKRIGKFYNLEPIKATPGQIKITTHSFDRKTSLAIMETLQKVLDEERLSHLKEDFSKKIALISDLIEKERANLSEKGLEVLVEDNDRFQAQNEELKRRIMHVNSVLADYNLMLVNAESKLKHIKKIKNYSINSQKQIDYEKAKSTRTQIEELRENLYLMRQNKNPTNHDKLVINQIEDKVKKLSTEMGQYGDLDSEASFMGEKEFASNQERNTKYLDLDYKIIKDKIEKLSIEQKNLLDEQKKILDERINNQKRRDSLQPQIDYLKLLETKHASAKLLESSIISDVKFEEINPHVNIFRRIDLSKIIIFTNLICFFLGFLFIIIRFLGDDKIYDQVDTSHHFSDLPVIGKTPEFE